MVVMIVEFASWLPTPAAWLMALKPLAPTNDDPPISVVSDWAHARPTNVFAQRIAARRAMLHRVIFTVRTSPPREGRLAIWDIAIEWSTVTS